MPTPQELLARIQALKWDESTIIEQNNLIRELLAMRQSYSAVDCAVVEAEFQKQLGITRDEWFRLLASVDTERFKIINVHWQKRSLPKQPPQSAGSANVGSVGNAQGLPISNPIISIPPTPPIAPSGSGQSTIYPMGGWLGEYLHTFANGMESPDSFIFWSGVAAIAAVARRHVWLPFGQGAIFPNFYIILTSDPAKARKGPPIKTAGHLVHTIPDINFLDRTTTERLPHDMAYRINTIGTATTRVPADANAFICSEELVTFLDDQTYNIGVIKFLIDWWDCPDERSVRTHKHGVITLKNICPTMLAGTTPAWLQTALSHIVIGGGLLSRTIFVVEDRTAKRISIPEAVDNTVYQRLAQQLTYIETINGAFSLDAGARAWMDIWYNQYRDFVETHPEEAASIERKQAHLIKLSMVLALSENLPLNLTPDLMSRSDRILGAVEKNLPDAARMLQATTAGRDYVRVLEHIRKAPGGQIEWSDLLRRNSPYGLDKDVLRKICQTLEQQNDVESASVPGKGGRRKVEIWKAIPKTP